MTAATDPAVLARSQGLGLTPLFVELSFHIPSLSFAASDSVQPGRFCAMGSHLFHAMPRTGGYSRVIALLGDSAGGGGRSGVAAGSIAAIADAGLTAALSGLNMARADAGLAYTWHLMVELVRSSRDSPFLLALERIGVPTPAQISGLPDIPIIVEPGQYNVYDLTSGFTAAVDRRLIRDRSRTDVSEIGQLAASESLSGLVSVENLFGDGARLVQDKLKSFSHERGFGILANDYFGKLIRRFLEYHLSRELSNHVGPHRRFRDVDEHNEFLRQFDYHCHSCASVVQHFAGQWLRKRYRLGDFSLQKSKGFVAHALTLVRGSLAYQEGRDA